MGRAESIIRRFPDFYKLEDFDNIFHQFIEVFGQTLDQAESDLLKVMHAHWVDTADNEGSRGFDTAQKGDLDKIFSLYLENLGGTSQLKQGVQEADVNYRNRIKGLIHVLKNGASTKEGIIAIVAANLGLIGDDTEVVQAREKIRIVEFLPEPLKTDSYSLALFEEFAVGNPNVIETTPEIRIRVRLDFNLPLVNPRIINLSTNRFASYHGGVKSGDVLSFFSNGTALLNGVAIPIEGDTPVMPPGTSHWRIEASIGMAEGAFDRSLYDYSIYDQPRLNRIGRFDIEGSEFDEAVFAVLDPAVDIDLTLVKLTPAAFMVCIPWDIPGGFTDHNQIKYIVNKVKAAGVFAVIAYEKQFMEIHEQTDFFSGQAQRKPLVEEHLSEEVNFDIGSIQKPYPTGIEHDMSDTLITSGMFDYTTFDSLNTFA